MNEKILARFVVRSHEVDQFYKELESISGSYRILDFDKEIESEDGVIDIEDNFIKMEIDSAAASYISLSSKFLSERMIVSYISQSLKDQYRK